jgi:hypothetical protein
MRTSRSLSRLAALARSGDLAAIRAHLSGMPPDELMGLEKAMPLLARLLGHSPVLTPLRRMIRQCIDRASTDNRLD